MGSLLRFPFSDSFVERFSVFVETGTGAGISLGHAAKHKFQRLWSIDCWRPHYLSAAEEFKDDPRVILLFGESAEALNNLLFAYKGPAFFFLDAHLPGCDFGGEPPDKELDFKVRFPLKRELETIRWHRPDGNYCLLIDDLRFYQDGRWGDGDISDGALRKSVLEALEPEDRNLSFLEPFYKTHDVQIEERDSGYAIIKPYGTPSLEFRG